MVKIDKKLFTNYFSRAWRELLVIAGVLFVDLLSKFLVDKYMILDGPKKTIIPKFFHISYTKNPNAAFSFDFGLSDKLGDSGMRTLFIVFVSIALLAFMIFMVFGYKNSFLYRLPLALIVGGAAGNLYDRIVHQAVRDFLQVEYFGGQLFGNSFFPTFNLADSALVIGATLFLFYFIFFFSKDEKRKLAAKAAKEKNSEETTENSEQTSQENLCENATKPVNFADLENFGPTESIPTNTSFNKNSDTNPNVKTGGEDGGA